MMINAASLHALTFALKIFLLNESLKQQCKCQMHENLFLGLAAMGIYYEKDW